MILIINDMVSVVLLSCGMHCNQLVWLVSLILHFLFSVCEYLPSNEHSQPALPIYCNKYWLISCHVLLSLASFFRIKSCILMLDCGFFPTVCIASVNVSM